MTMLNMPLRSMPESAINIVGLGMVESDSGFEPFVPSWFNAWEAYFHQQASKRQGKKTWLFNRFGMPAENRSPEDVRKADYREALNSLSSACKMAFEDAGRKKENQIRKQKSALLYFDAWGETSVLERPNSWRDAISIDMLPKSITREYGISDFSCKLRGERSGFLQGLRLASDMLNSGTVDTVVLCGLFRSIPALALSTAALKVPLHGKKDSNISNRYYSVERAGCVLLRKEAGTGIALNVAEHFLLPARRSPALSLLTEKWRQHHQPTRVYAGMHPSSEIQAIEEAACGQLASKPDYISISDLYGDSACLNPMLALTHLKSNINTHAQHSLVSASDGQGGVWLVDCWTGSLAE